MPKASIKTSQARTEHPCMASGMRQERKAWIKRPGASATQIRVREGDLVDDLRDAVLRKYANALARYDAPDLTVQLTVPSRSGRAGFETVLGPAEDICLMLDSTFPDGQTVDDALVIGVPADEHYLLRPIPAVALPSPETRRGDRKTKLIERSPTAPDTQAIRRRSARYDSPRGKRYASIAEESLEYFTPAQQIDVRTQQASKRAASQQTTAPPLESPVPPINVLFVDDNMISIRSLAQRLKRWKVPHETASHGQEALDKWKAGPEWSTINGFLTF